METKFKYLVVKMDDDENMIEPLCITEDYKSYLSPMRKIFKIKEDGSFQEIKGRAEYGLCLVDMHDSDDKDDWTILEKLPCTNREEGVKTKIFKSWLKKYDFDKSDREEITRTVVNTGGECFCVYAKLEQDLAITEYEGTHLWYPY